MSMRKLSILAGLVLFFSVEAVAANYYCDPVNGSMASPAT